MILMKIYFQSAKNVEEKTESKDEPMEAESASSETEPPVAS